MDWKNKRLLFAVGCAAIASVFVALKWLFTDSLLSAADTIDEGKTGSVATAVVPLAIDFLCWFIIAIGTYVVAGTRLLFEGFRKATDSTVPVATSIQSGSLQTDAKALERIVLDLGNAVAINDQVSVATLQRQLRLPFALDEMQRAYREGNVKLGKSLANEIEGLIESPEIVADGSESGVEPSSNRRRGGK
jgi:hypothetical protein